MFDSRKTWRAFRLALLCGASVIALHRARAQAPTEFGSVQYNQYALIGILYDLKQDQARHPLPMNIPAYNNLIDEFLSKNWDESVLNRFFRVSRPLYTTQIFVPLTSAASAPVAFGVEKIVKPMFWVIHYKGQVSPPSDGEWRFWGWGEEVCSVAVNGKNVLLANWPEIKAPTVGWKSPEPPGEKAANGHLIAGDWIPLKAKDIVDLDVLIGERGGGVFATFLMIEKRGDKYETVNGHPILPIFQLAPYKTPLPSGPGIAPQFAPDGPVWVASP